MLTGKKTYLVAIGGLLLAAGGFLHGDLSTVQALQDVVAALATMALRSGINTAGGL